MQKFTTLTAVAAPPRDADFLAPFDQLLDGWRQRAVDLGFDTELVCDQINADIDHQPGLIEIEVFMPDVEGAAHGGQTHLAALEAREARVVAGEVSPGALVVAADVRGRNVVTRGWEKTLDLDIADLLAELNTLPLGGVLVTAVHPQAFGQAIGLTRRGGTIVFNGLPPGDFPAPIFDIVLKGLTIRGSIVGTRQDMVEALDFYARGLIHPTVQTAALDDINEVFGRMERGEIDGRVVIDYR